MMTPESAGPDVIGESDSGGDEVTALPQRGQQTRRASPTLGPAAPYDGGVNLVAAQLF